MCRSYEWVFGPKFSKQWSFFGRFSINIGGLSKYWRKIGKTGRFLPKFVIKVGMTASVGSHKRVSF